MTAIDQRGHARRRLIRRAITIASCAVSLSLAGSFAMAAQPGIVVGDSAQLLAALQRVRGGETILLRPGVGYRPLVINVRPDAEVVIRSLDPERRGIIAGLDLRAVRNLTFDTLRFADEGAQARKHYDIRVTNSENVRFANSVFDGGARGYARTKADAASNLLLVRGSNGFIFERNVVGRYLHGLACLKCRAVLIRDNEIHSLQGDGMHFAQVRGITIANNRFHDFFGSDQKKVTHNDYIQFWTTNTTAPSADIVIHGNVFKSGQFQSQVIFFRDQLGDLGKGEMRYRNVLIEKNIIHNNNYHGITLASTDVAIIQGNRFMPHSGEGRSSSINVLKSTEVVIRGNVAPRMNIAEDNKSVIISGNTVSQRRLIPLPPLRSASCRSPA